MRLLLWVIVLAIAWSGYNFYFNDLKPRESYSSETEPCDFQEGSTVTISVDLERAFPECVKVRPTQNLKVDNNTDKVVRVWFDNSRFNFSASANINPYNNFIYSRQFGKYLEYGVHKLHISTLKGNGPEIWLVR